MKIKKISIFVLGFMSWVLCLGLCYAAGGDKPVTAETRISKKTVLVGDKIYYDVTIKTKSGTEVEFPEVKDKLGIFSVKGCRDSRSEIFGKKIIKRKYTLQSFTPGKSAIPELLIKYKEKAGASGQVETGSVEVEVKSVLGKDAANADIKDIKGPVGIFNRGFFVFILLALAALAAGAAAWLRLRRKGEAARQFPEIRRPAHEIAYEELEGLRRKALVRAGQVKEFYAQLSLILRRYLENRFNIHAPEMTTEEFLVKVKEERVVSYEHRNILRDFLSHCDMVKFAKYGPSSEEIEASFALVKKFVDQTKERGAAQEVLDEKQD